MDSNSGGYFDLQVNGYAGLDFNQDDLTGDDLHAVCERLAADGVGGILATIVTEHVDKMERRLRNLVALGNRTPRAADHRGHSHRGAVPERDARLSRRASRDAIHPADAGEMDRLLDAAGGLTRWSRSRPNATRPEGNADAGRTKHHGRRRPLRPQPRRTAGRD
jgi:N-acetylglucosamine-6-phosphate deacetylase